MLYGAAHAYKSSVPGVGEEVGTAGAQLTERLGASDVYIVFQHVLPGDNSEPQNGPLMDVFNDSFISEMKRRSRYMGWNNREDIWFGYNVDNLSIDKIEQALLED